MNISSNTNTERINILKYNPRNFIFKRKWKLAICPESAELLMCEVLASSVENKNAYWKKSLINK